MTDRSDGEARRDRVDELRGGLGDARERAGRAYDEAFALKKARGARGADDPADVVLEAAIELAVAMQQVVDAVDDLMGERPGA